MSTQTVNVGVNVNDNGTAKKTIKNVEELHSSIKATQRTAERINVGGSVPKSAGYRAAAAAPSGAQAQMTGEDYGRARGSAGGTGASARDFANQAQGLGGLVRLYATYAANIFAVSAAFMALSNAMDTSNMVKGLDQLGAASGVALGSLSKRLITATDGAISLREAMEATVKASSSGMNSDDILRMGKVAKQASQALGVDMSDAVSRLTRGITKLEPELLDELGIFTRVGTASEAYAKSVNKSVNALTDFEKRAAFANAVLAEGEAKFGKIELNTNPYTKILASIKDLAQSGLELVNKVLGPLIGMLSTSPTALAIALGSIGLLLFKQAIPAIGQFREGLQASASDALNAAKAFKESFGDEFQARLEKRFKIPSLEADVKKAEIALASLNFPGKIPKAVENIQTEEYNEKVIEKMITSRQTLIETGMVKEKVASEASINNAKQQITYIEKELELRKANQELKEAEGRALELADKPLGALDPEIIAFKQFQELKEQAASLSAISSASENARIVGVRGAWTLLNQEVNENGITGIRRYTTLARGGLAAVGTRVLGIVDAFGQVGEFIGIAVAGFALLNDWLTKTAEQTKQTSESLKVLEEASKNLANTLEFISKKDPLEGFNLESIKARATALGELTNSLSSFSEKSINELNAMGSWDKGVDWVKSFWSGDVQSNLTSTISSGLVEVFNAVEGNSAVASAAKKSVEELLKIENAESLGQIISALDKLGDKDKQSAIEKLVKITANLGDEAKISAAKGTELAAAFATLETTRKKIDSSFIPKDDLSQFGTQLLDAFSKLNLALEDPVQRLNAIKTLSKEILQVPGATLSEVLGLQKLAKQVDEVDQATLKYNETRKASKAIETQIQDIMRNDIKTARAIAGDTAFNVTMDLNVIEKKLVTDLLRQLQEIKKLEKINLNIKTQLTTEVEKGMGLAEQAQLRVFKTGTDLITAGLNAVWAKAGTTITNAYAYVLSGTETGIKMRAASDTALINAQIAQIDSQRSLTIATRELALQLKEKEISDLKANSSGRNDKITEVNKKESELVIEREALKRAIAGDTKGLSGKLLGQLESSGGKLSDINTSGIQFAQSMEASAAAVANLKAQITAVQIGKTFALLDLATQKRVQAIQTEVEMLGVKKEELDLTKQINGEFSKRYIEAKQENERSILAKQQEIALITKQALVEKFTLAKAPLEARKATEDVVAERNSQVSAKALLAERQRIESVDAGYKRVNQELERTIKLNEIKLTGIVAEQDAQAAVSEIQLSTSEQTKKFTDTYLKDKQYELSVFKTIEESKRAEDAATNSTINTQRRLAQEYQTELAKNKGVENNATNFILDEIRAEAEAYTLVVAGIQAKTAAQLASTTVLKTYNDEQSRFNTLIEDLQGLDSIFEGVGSKLAEVANSFKALADSQAQYAATVANLDEKLFDAKGPEEQNKLFKEIKKTQQDQQKAEITGYAKTAGAAKGMFKEKTGAYKALAAVEKVLHIQRIAMDLKEMFQKLFTDKVEVASTVVAEGSKTAATSAGFLSRTGTYISEIFAKFTASMGPWGWAAAAAVVAAIFGGGGKGSAAAFVPSAEQRQETQGTAMSYNSSGELVQTSRGVLGDTSAKSESIANSLEIIRDNSVDGLDYDNKMLRALEGLRNALDSTAKGLYSITGLRAGSLSGIVEGTNTSGGLLGIGGIFSKSTSTSIIDSGLQLRGSFLDLIKGISGTINTFETVSTTVKKSGFLGFGGSTKTNVTTNFRDLAGIDQKAFSSIVKAFGYAGDLLYDVAEIANISANTVTSAIANIRVDEMASLRGLTGENFTKELSAVIGKVLDDASYVIFTEFEQFANFGEGMLETVVRVIDTSKKVNQALINLGNTNSLLGNFDLSEKLVNAAGGLDVFLDRAEYFRSNFLTEAEQIAPVASAVSKELKRLAALGYTSADGLVDTRVEFKNLVQSLDLTTERGIETYTALMQVSEGFYQVTETANKGLEDTISRLKDFSNQIRDFKASLFLGSSSILTPEQKYLESRSQFEELYAKALAGDKDAMSKVTSSAQSFLDASKTYFASSAAYTSDFNSVLSKLDQADLSAQQTATDAEQQLGVLNTQVGLLTSINSNIATIAGVPGLAGGGRASGLTLVGELGPELVDFTNPARVYTSDQTAGMFNSPTNTNQVFANIATEIRSLKQEVIQLRKEQQKQTGDIIVSNYDANKRNADEVALAVEDSAGLAVWQTRSKVVIK